MKPVEVFMSVKPTVLDDGFLVTVLYGRCDIRRKAVCSSYAEMDEEAARLVAEAQAQTRADELGERKGERGFVVWASLARGVRKPNGFDDWAHRLSRRFVPYRAAEASAP